ncbi:MAG TPA: hypothetical protein DCK79_03870 [Candidatus Atribacteria bacterium]|nr:MAG: hypothetical protein XE08_0158 [Parcubacteria bacterium 32_520]HAJ32493.1 hypothetical protein [Candidatus Atribacteria bacterium]
MISNLKHLQKITENYKNWAGNLWREGRDMNAETCLVLDFMLTTLTILTNFDKEQKKIKKYMEELLKEAKNDN